ncbi:MAG: FHA domain-containing protein [Bacteroides sp.]|nr:FHA domain-containing protein [Bacteroides sp.]
MNKEYIIGRNNDSPIKVPANKVGVSGRHAKIVIASDGSWYLEDLSSTNGTFIRNEDGEFIKVFSKQIKDSDIIRLGNGGVNSFTFTARRIIANDESYAYEFKQLKRALKLQREKEAEKEKKIELNGWISKLSGLGAIAVCALLGSIEGVTIDPNTRYILIACAPVVVGLIFSGDQKAYKALRRKREKILTCPKCGKPLPEYDIEEGQCSRCKAQ